jgi:hypothetical protein
MTAPYKRDGFQPTIGNQLRRIKKLENADTLAFTDNWTYDFGASPPYSFGHVFCDSGTDPTSFNTTLPSVTVQESNVTCYVNVQGNNLGSGSGTQYLLPVSAYIQGNLWNAGITENFLYDYINSFNAPTVGAGVCFDQSANAYTACWFRFSQFTVPAFPSLYCIEAFLADGSAVGPGNPYTWALGDQVMTGVFNLALTPTEQT